MDNNNNNDNVWRETTDAEKEAFSSFKPDGLLTAAQESVGIKLIKFNTVTGEVID